MQLTKIIEAMDLEVLTPVAEDREVLGAIPATCSAG